MNMEEVAKTVAKHVDTVEGLKAKKERLQGRKDSEMKAILDRGFETLDAANDFIDAEDSALEKIETEIVDSLKEIEQDYAEYLG